MRPAQLPSSTLAAVVLTAALAIGLAAPRPAAANWEESPAADVAAATLDLLLVRPLATAKVAVGVAMFIPAALFSSPMGGEGIDGAYETLIEVPAEYAFERPIGDL